MKRILKWVRGLLQVLHRGIRSYFLTWNRGGIRIDHATIGSERFED